MIERLLPLIEMPTWACCQIEHNCISCSDCQHNRPPYSLDAEIRVINAAFFESTCFSCGHIYQWHREHRNQCPQCHWDCGFLVDLSRGIGELRDFLPLSE